MLRLSLRRRRQLLPWLFIGPGLLWLIVFFVIPLINQLNVSLQSGDAESGYTFDVGVQRLQERDLGLLDALPALDRLRGGGDDPVPDHRLPARVLHGVQGGAVQEPDPAADHPAVLRLLRAADGGLAADPVRRRLGARSPARRRPAVAGRAPAGDADGGDRGHHLQLPAVHGAAAVRVAREDRPAAHRGGDRPLREPHHRVPQGHAAARAAGHLRRLAADLHPGVRRLHQRRAARHARAST